MNKKVSLVIALLFLLQSVLFLQADCKTTANCFGDPNAPSFALLKKDADTKKPLAGAIFTIYDKHGTIVCEYTTDHNGKIVVKELKSGWYKVAETKAPDGYHIDDIPRDFEVKKGITQKMVFENTKLPGLFVKLLDETTHAPIPNNHYRLLNRDGVVISSFRTNFDGNFHMPEIKPGFYQIQESKSAPNYDKDKEITSFEIKRNEAKHIVLYKRKSAGLTIHKIDAITGKPLQGVEFLIKKPNGFPLGTFTTDENGRIVIDEQTLEHGTYKIKETKTLPNYMLDDKERIVKVQTGIMSNITMENTPKTGFVHVLKRTGSDNITDGTTAGSPLKDATFSLFDMKTGEELFSFTSKENGWAISERIPLGEYILKETKAPYGYRLSQKEIKVNLTEQNQMLKYEMLNYPSNLRVELQKYGPSNVLVGSHATYTLTGIRNMSAVALNNFYVRDVFPKDILQPISLETGTYNTHNMYHVSVTTNQNREVIIATGLSTTVNHKLDFSAPALNLKNKEQVESVTFHFGNVPTGFAQVTDMKLHTIVAKGLPNGLHFVNKADVGGSYQGEWTMKNITSTSSLHPNSHGTTIVNPHSPKIPKTGF